MKTAPLQRVAHIASFDRNPLRRLRANRILRVRYGVAIRPRQTLDPVWLAAMT